MGCQNTYEYKLKKKVTAVIDQEHLVILHHCINHDKTLPSASKLS